MATSNVADRNTLLREVMTALQTRGLRIASIDANSIHRIFHHASGTLTPTAGTTAIVIEFRNSVLPAYDEKIHGVGDHPNVPDPTRL